MNYVRFYTLVGQSPVETPPADILAWARAFDSDNRTVARSSIGPYVVSTIFLGLAYEDPPLLFETAVFCGQWRSGDATRRCATWTEAKAQHEAVCSEWRKKATL